VSVISQYVGLHFRKVYEQGCDLQMVSATSPAGQWMLKEIFRYITREGGRLAARVQKASVWSSAAQRRLAGVSASRRGIIIGTMVPGFAKASSTKPKGSRNCSWNRRASIGSSALVAPINSPPKASRAGLPCNPRM
jgi:hypothetical protein